MKKDIPNRNLKDLSVKQQLGLFVVLTKLYDPKNRHFYSSDFAEKIKPFLAKTDQDEIRRIIGGILGALSKNGIIEKVSSDRDPLWKLPEDIHKDPEYYRNELQHIPQVITHWQE